MRALSVAVALLVACGQDPAGPEDTSGSTSTGTTPTGTTPTGTTPTGTTPTTPDCAQALTLTHGEAGCFGYDDQWEGKADLAGCAEAAAVSIWRTDGEPWDEEHPLTIYQEGPESTWQAWHFGPIAHATPAWEPGVSSAFDCQADAGKLTFAVRMFDAAGDARACAVWGHDPALVIGGGASSVNTADPASFADCVIQEW